jgi:hypothetical protein
VNYYRPRRRLLAAGLALFGAASLLITGCGALTSTTAALRIVNAVPGTNGIDFSVGGTGFVNDLKFKDVTTYGFVSQGSNDFVGTQNGSSNVTVPTQTFTLKQAVYTAAAAGVSGSTTTPPTFFLFTDDNTILNQHRIRVRVINLSPDAGPVNVAAGSLPLATSIPYGTASSYAVVPEGTYDVTASPASGTGAIATQAAVPLGVSKAPFHVFTIFIEGQVSNNTAVIVTQADE